MVSQGNWGVGEADLRFTLPDEIALSWEVPSIVSENEFCYVLQGRFPFPVGGSDQGGAKPAETPCDDIGKSGIRFSNRCQRRRSCTPETSTLISREPVCYEPQKGERMSELRAKHWESLKEQGFIPLCSDWNADGTEMICEVFMDGGFGCAECISCRQAYRKDEDGNIEYYR